MNLHIESRSEHVEAERVALVAPLKEHNWSKAGDPGLVPVSLLLVDDDGKVHGGLWGMIGFDWLYIEFLAVPEAARGRGLGAQLMRQAEAKAAENGCRGIWLDTFDFQAPEFYRKLGFEVFGTIDDHPVGHTRYFLRKTL